MERPRHLWQPVRCDNHTVRYPRSGDRIARQTRHYSAKTLSQSDNQGRSELSLCPNHTRGTSIRWSALVSPIASKSRPFQVGKCAEKEQRTFPQRSESRRGPLTLASLDLSPHSGER